jgi:DNA-binding MarR family transcriptional regulator
MNKNQFFKPTVLYKEYMILDMIEKDSRVTQREISKEIGIALSMVNDHLDQFEKEKLVKRIKHSTKNVEYLITKKGVERKKVLNIGYLSSAQQMYNSAKDNISIFLNQIVEKGHKNILLYGAGEVAEILLQTLLIDKNNQINVLAVIDDDKTKQGNKLVKTSIISPSEVSKYEFDGILISSYTNQKLILVKLKAIGYEDNNILHFFE